MGKTYTYERPYFTIEVTVTTAFCALIDVACAVIAARGGAWGLPAPLFVLFLVAAVYQVWNVVVSRAYPEHVTVDDEAITFELYGRQDRYEIVQLTQFLVRANPRTGRVYLRVNAPTLTRGRYWVETSKFTDGRELFDYVVDLEYRVHPDSLKARARRTNEEYLAHANEIAELRDKSRNKHRRANKR